MQLGREAGKTEARSKKRETRSRKEVGSKKQEARSKKQESARNKKRNKKQETRNKKTRQQPPFDPGWMFKRINLQIAGRFVHRPVTKAALKLPMT